MKHEQGDAKITNEPGILCRVKIAMRNGTVTYVIARSCTEGREIAKRLGHDTRYARVSLDGVVTPPLIDRAEALLRELLPTMPTTIRTRAELFLSRQGGRPRKVDRELCRRLRADGVSAAEIAVRIGCCESNVYRALKNKEE